MSEIDKTQPLVLRLAERRFKWEKHNSALQQGSAVTISRALILLARCNP